MNEFPSLKQLHYLVTLHETRHFGEAAKQCFVSQSALRSGIQNLEDVVPRSREILARSQDLMELAQVS
ncbi:DNA-binding transcriptional regulator OxyR [Grimontia marina]|uniref:DNA-binding transcriptional regulator OxyR n=1 Tax=Grimontia marina TaxID=646534 RepID=A0A128EUP6_9GAMM|nr:DNA-binding transcriptional regulator OxyR [Grimontia marina]